METEEICREPNETKQTPMEIPNRLVESQLTWKPNDSKPDPGRLDFRLKPDDRLSFRILDENHDTCED